LTENEMSATYTKLKSGEWGVRVEGAVKEGQSVTVRKKNGETKTETVKKVVWSGGGISLCAVTGGSGSSYTPRASRGRRTGCSCGSIDGEINDGDCWTCRHDAM
jgi:hypothetical protein